MDTEPTTATPQQSAPNARSPEGVTIPSWLLQLIPVILVLFGAATVYATQRSDVDQLKSDVKEIRISDGQLVPKTIFDIKMEMQAGTNKRIEDKIDNLESLVRGLYDRMPPQPQPHK